MTHPSAPLADWDGLGDASSHQSSSADSEPAYYTASRHWIAFCLILVSSALGVLLPVASLLSARLRLPDFAYVLGKCVSIGVVLSVAVVHMLPPSLEALQDERVGERLREVTEPLPFVLCVAGALLMHTAELLVHSVAGSCCRAPSDLTTSDPPAVGGAEDPEMDLETRGLLASEAPVTPVTSVDPRHEVHSHIHIHGTDGVELHGFVQALLFEFGVSVHSIFVGLVAGVCSDNEAATLVTAICLHQMFEGLALGSRLVDAPMRVRSVVLFTAFFALSAPLGAAIGIAVVSTATVAVLGQTYLLTQGVLDGLCAGVLLYLGFAMLLGDFPQDLAKHCGVGAQAAASGNSVRRVSKAVAMVAFLWIGAAVMCAIGWYV